MPEADGVAPATMDEAFEMGAAEVEAAPSPVKDPTQPPAEAPTPETVSESEEAGQPRTPDGKFAAKPAAEAPALTEPVADAASAEPEPAAVDLSTFPPLTFRANGRDLPFEGSVASEHGAWFPKDILPQLTRQLAAAVNASELGNRYHHDKQQLIQQHTEQMESVKSELQITQELVAQFEILRKQAMTDPDGVLAFLQDERGWELWLSKAEAKKQSAKLQQLTKREETQRQEAQKQSQVPLMQRDFSTTLDRLVEEAKAAGLPLERGKLENRLLGQWDRIFRPATEQDVQNGFRGQVGEMLFDYGPMVQEVQWAAELLRQARPAPVKAPAKTNPVPPAARSKAPTSGTGGGKKEAPQFQSAREAFESAFS